MNVICYKWGECDVLWRNANWTWSECLLVQEVVGGLPQHAGVPGEFALPPWLQNEKDLNPLEKEKRKRFIRLIAKVKGESEFNKNTEVREDIKITVKDIQLVTRAVRGIDIQIIEE